MGTRPAAKATTGMPDGSNLVGDPLFFYVLKSRSGNWILALVKTRKYIMVFVQVSNLYGNHFSSI